MSTKVKVEQPDFDNTEILNDDEIKQIGEEVQELIELLDNDEDSNDSKDSTVMRYRYPGLIPKSLKRNYETTGVLFKLFNVEIIKQY